MMRRLLCLLACLLAFTASAWAHEVRPAYLELRQTGSDTYDVLWKVPGLGDEMRLGLYVKWPEGSSDTSRHRGAFVNNAFIERWSVKRVGGLAGGTIEIEGLRGTSTDVLVRMERLDGASQLTRLTPSAPSFVVAASPGWAEVLRSYAALGVEHILGGIDHLLFVLALLIVTRGSWRLVKTVSAFTLAHSLTLGLATLGVVHVPAVVQAIQQFGGQPAVAAEPVLHCASAHLGPRLPGLIMGVIAWTSGRRPLRAARQRTGAGVASARGRVRPCVRRSAGKRVRPGPRRCSC